MLVPVYMTAFIGKKIKFVEIPDNEANGKSKDEILELVFHYGQNDFSEYNQNLPSVSVGDTVYINHEYWVVMPTGYKQISTIEFKDMKCPNAEAAMFGK